MPSPMRKVAVGANVALSLVLAFVALVAANVIAARHPTIWDWTTTGEFTLSDKTRNILKGLPAEMPVEIAVFLDPLDDLGRRVHNLLRRYEADAGGRIRVLAPRSEQDLVDLQKKGFEIPSPRSDVRVVVKHGDRAEKINESRLAEMSATGYRRRVGKFTAESALTYAIKAVTEGTRKRVAFLAGHGEVASRTPEAAEITKALEAESIDCFDANLVETNLEGVDLAVIWGPRTPYAPTELAHLGGFLRKGGRALFLLEPVLTPERKGFIQTGLETTLAEWGVKVGDEMIFDLDRPEEQVVLFYRGGVLMMGGSRDMFPTGFNPGHPITETLHQFTQIGPILPANVVFHTVRPVEPRDKDERHVTPLIQTFPNTIGIYDLSVQEVEPDAPTTRRGPFAIAVAVEKQETEGGPKTRLAAFGDASFVAPEVLRQFPFNKDLFLNTVNWLLEKEDSMGIGPKSASTFLSMRLGTPEARAWVWRTSFLFLPGGALILALFVWWVRKA